MTQLVNLPRARAIMAAEGLDGLIATCPINVYYLSTYWGLLMSAERFDAAFFAVLPADEDRPSALVVPSMELRRLVTEGGTWMDETFIYTSPDGEFDQVAVQGMPYPGWPIDESTELTSLERDWISATQQQVGRVSGNAMGALRRALKACGLDHSARLVTDDHRIGSWLELAKLTTIQCHARASVFNQIRLVKTPTEIELMREAAKINEAAMLKATTAFKEDAQWHEIETSYCTAMAARGGVASYLMCGAGGPPSGVIRRNEPMFLDALGTYRQYHGDVGRCVVLGTPNQKMKRRHHALCAGWEAVQEKLKPGVRYSELARTAVDAVRRSGLPEFVYATPHAVGLEHTDDPKPAGVQQGMTGDVVLEPNMVINVDMPFTEIGWGSVHLEDTVVIKSDGHEVLTSADLDIITIEG